MAKLFRKALPPQVSFLNGPVNAEYKPKALAKRLGGVKRKHPSESESDVETPEEVIQLSKADLSSDPKRLINFLKSDLKERSVEGVSKANTQLSQHVNSKEAASAESEASCVNLEDMFVASYTRTVEKVYFLSHLLHHGNAGIKRRKLEESEEIKEKTGVSLMPGPVMYPQSNDESTNKTGPARASIVSFSYKVCRKRLI